MTTYAMTFWEFRPIVETDARIAWKLVQALAHRLREADARLAARMTRAACGGRTYLTEPATRSSRARAGSPERARSPRPARLGRQCLRRRHSARARTAHDLSRRLPKRGRGIDASLTRDDEIERGRIEPDRIEHVGRAGDELGAERSERRPQPTGSAGRGLFETTQLVLGKRRSSSVTAARSAPFCGPKRLGASSSVALTSHATRAGTGSASTTSSSPAPASIVAVPPRASTRPFAPSSRAARTSSPKPRLDAASGSSRVGSSGTAAAASTTAVPSGRTSQRAARGAPNAS